MWWARLNHRDHPRVCGEHDGADRTFNVSTGSSPRMRGTLFDVPSVFVNMGIIPAYAGNTIPSRPFAATTWDHPRVCGEHTPSRLALEVP